MQDAVMGFDLGSTHLKWLVVGRDSAESIWRGAADISPIGSGGVSEQNPEQVWQAVDAALNQAGARANIKVLGFSAAMHSLIVVNHDSPITASLTWMDARSQATAQMLRASGAAARLWTRTGVPTHSMSPLVKWLHLRRDLPDTSYPVALKDYIIYRLTGTWVTDYSTAGASGFLGLDNRWDEEALALAGLCNAEMLPLLPMTERICGLGTEVVVGGNDGALAHHHLGVKADDGTAVLAMGTSGALRVTRDKPVTGRGLFSYTMGPNAGYLVGTALSNVGNVLAWLSHVFHQPIDGLVTEGLSVLHKHASLPLTIGYWYGERSPWWREDLRGAWLGLGPEHSRADLVASTLLSLAASFWQGLEALKQSGVVVSHIRGGSGLLDMPNMAQWMADALGEPITLVDQGDASLLGAIELALGHDCAVSGGQPTVYHPRDPIIQQVVQERWHEVQQWVTAQL